MLQANSHINDANGLPESYEEPEVDVGAEAVFEHMYRMNA
jgi:hypothetical protein